MKDSYVRYSRLRRLLDPLAERMEVLSTGLLGNIVQRPGRDRVGSRDRHRPHFARVGVLVSECRVTPLAADRDKAVFGQRRQYLVGGKRRTDHGLLEPGRRA